MLEVGDRIIFRYKNERGKYMKLITESDISISSKDDIEILQIERPKWEVMKERVVDRGRKYIWNIVNTTKNPKR